ncbi:MAG: DUF1176 domain-containing protein [Rhodobacteraceae bacterium]|nr:DUF1176 domain-containing protein [Paracoccaceae bacterium]
MSVFKCISQFCRIVALLTLAAMSPAQALASDATKIPLKLFGETEIDGGLATCRLALWQHNRDPQSDSYAYVLHASLGSDGSAAPARIEIGDDPFYPEELMRSNARINGVAKHFLFATTDRATRVHIEVMEASDESSYISIERARAYFIQSNKVPFSVKVKGIYGCPESDETVASADSTPQSPTWNGPLGIPIGPGKMLDDASEVPTALTEQLYQYASDACFFDEPFHWAGARYTVNENYLLWELPCTQGAYQGASVFGITQNPPNDWAEVLTVPNPPALEGNQNYGIMNPMIDNAKGLIRSTALNRGAGDCGVHQVLRLIDGPGEVLELELLEYRDKYECDGKATAPETWPLAYSAY